MRKLLILLLFFQSAEAIDITAFGGIGNGIFDNYYVFKVAAAYAASHPNTTLTFPAGTFYIAKYESYKNDTINDIKWDSCIGLKIIGTTGSIISTNGTFARLLNYVTPTSCAKKSYTSGISPFLFYNCRNIEVRNLEITGNVQNTTRVAGKDINNPTVTEGNNVLLNFERCDTVLVDNCYLHHAESDGITISGDRVAGIFINSKHFTITNTRSWHNGRQGMSIGGLDTGYFYKCDFSYTGFTDGSYGHNDPAAGVDIEPGEFHTTSFLTFDSCYFTGNYGAQINLSYPTTSNHVTLLKCVLTGQGNEKTQGITMLGRSTLIDSCFISIGNRDIKVTNSAKPGATIGIRNSTIESSGTWINTSSSNMTDSVVIEGNNISYVTSTMGSAFIMLHTNNLKFQNNTIYASSTAIASKPIGSHVFIQNAIISSGNVFATGLRVDYTGTTTVADP